jgi:mRNA interferase MazF
MKKTEIEINLEPGDVVLLDFPGVQQTKRRPAVIVSSHVYHRQRPDVIVGLITSQVKAATAATDYLLQDWTQAKLRQPSAFRSFLVTLPRLLISQRVGKLSNRDWQSVLQRIRLAISSGHGH